MNLRCAVSCVLICAATTAFADTPEKLDNPDALRQGVERLRKQESWTDFASSQQINLFDGPETVWPEIPASQYDLAGFDQSVLGGKLPPPGVHPRVLFNQEDLPTMRRELLSTPEGQRKFFLTQYIFQHTMLDPSKPDGQVFAKLVSGDLEGLKFPDPYEGANGNHMFVGYKPGIYSAHVCYWPRNLAAIAFYALMENDEDLSRDSAVALCNYYKLREPLIDAHIGLSKDPNAANAWPADIWRGMHWVAGEAHLGIAYDLAARYMSEDQKAFMRRIIARATAGRRSYSSNGPERWRDTNWTGWDTQLLLCQLAIEGEEGYDPGVYAAERDTVRAYLTYGISRYGTIFETNGKNPAGLHFALVSAIALARRGDNYLGHPYLRKMSAEQVQQVVPAGGLNVNNGTYGCALFGNAGFLKNLYPQDACADWLIQQGQPVDDDQRSFDPVAYRAKLQPGKGSIVWQRLHPLTADDYFELGAYDSYKGSDGKWREPWERAYLNLPLDFEDPQHGQLCTRSGNGRDALFMMIEARPDLYCGGHQHHDAGHFYLSADGVNWGIESNHGMRTSLVHSVVMIDGKGQGDTQDCAPAKAAWLGAVINDSGALAVTDLKHAYDYIWTIPMHYSWNTEERRRFQWEPETDPEVVKIFRGTQHWKDRIWAQSYWEGNWGPTMRGKYNPVQYAFRTAGVIRGSHRYALVLDDIKKDDATRDYQWQMQVPVDARLVEAPEHQWMLVMGDTRNPGEPALWLKALGGEDTILEPRLEPVVLQKINGQRLVFSRQGNSGSFRVLMVPCRSGAPLPRFAVEDGGKKLTLAWGDQSDALAFAARPDHRTGVTVERAGKTILQVK